MKLFIDYLDKHIYKILILITSLVFFAIFSVSFLLLLNIDNEQKAIKEKINEHTLQFFQIEKEINEMKDNLSTQSNLIREIQEEIYSINAFNNSDDSIKGEITVQRIVDPLLNLVDSTSQDPEKRYIAVEIIARAINDSITMRSTFFNIYIQEELIGDISKNSPTTIIVAEKQFSGLDNSLNNVLLQPNELIQGWISFIIPKNAKIVGISFDNGVVSANLKLPNLNN
ncbi:MAG: hypothetical protein CL872_05815 [Dehalococcoidaceae bacterium]|nr:hypothetical protein [Dehalococcoidaceae bacterium]|tara:strand:+ start:630 stop:1310 length:681 start_codon:yes stop_codon:yes gene_type:complete